MVVYSKKRNQILEYELKSRSLKKNNLKNHIYQLDSQIVLKVKNLTKIYKTNGYTVEALKNVNLKIRKGEFVAIIGPSGSGKTTLVNTLGALDFPNSGKIIYNIDNTSEGHDITKMNSKEHKEMRLKKIGLIFQFYNLFPILSAYENVELPMIILKKNSAERKKRVESLLNLVGLGERMHHLPSQLSGGEMQRVAIARSLSNKPSILIADEPTGELDTETTTQIIKIFLELKNAGQSILMVTHNRRIAETADRILTLKDGEIINERTGGKPLEDIWKN
ncbi:MAG: ABC transporter ATP-binding protein [Candidatus Hermodarchaeota archaeon]